jgi:hypothetical protein
VVDNGTDLVFPQRLVPVLLRQRGPGWQELVERTIKCEPTDLEAVAFVLLIARLASCATCHMNTLRALHGCAQCGRQAVMRYRGSDQDLVKLYVQACQDVEQYVKSGS